MSAKRLCGNSPMPVSRPAYRTWGVSKGSARSCAGASHHRKSKMLNDGSDGLRDYVPLMNLHKLLGPPMA